MSKQKEYICKFTAEDLVSLSGKSIRTVKRWIESHLVDNGDCLVERPVNCLVEKHSERDTVEENKNTRPVERPVNCQVETPAYTPTPVAPPTFQPQQSRFDFEQMASQSLQDNKTETKSNYWKRLRASMGDVD